MQLVVGNGENVMRSLLRIFFQIFSITYLHIVIATLIFELLWDKSWFFHWFDSEIQLWGYAFVCAIFSICGLIGLFTFFGISLKNFLLLLLTGSIGFLACCFLAGSASNLLPLEFPALLFFVGEVLGALASSNIYIGLFILFLPALALSYGFFLLLEKYLRFDVKSWLMLVFGGFLAFFLSFLANSSHLQKILIHSRYPHAYGFLFTDGVFNVGPTFSLIVALVGAYFLKKELLYSFFYKKQKEPDKKGQSQAKEEEFPKVF